MRFQERGAEGRPRGHVGLLHLRGHHPGHLRDRADEALPPRRA